MATPAEPEVPQPDIDNEDVVSPKTKTATFELAEGPSMGPVSSVLTARADPDAQTTVTDFLDFTEYLPADMVRSLTLIGKLDERYADASHRVDDLTTLWGQLPGVPTHERPSPVQLRADISEHLNQALDSRIFAHAEAMRMAENVNRHYNKATALLSKLKTMMENYPTEDQTPAEPRSPQMTRAKLTVRATGEDGQKVRRSRVPRITVPGEVLAPYEIEYDTFSDDSDISSDEESEAPVMNRRIQAPTPRIKLVSNKSQKSSGRSSRGQYATPALSAAAAANAAALLNPPPENAVIGSPDAPWLQLTQYELAKLRKRMKKNATWTPSETMIARELKALCRGPDAYREAKKKAEEEGAVFEATVPTPIIDNESGTRQMPAGAISVDSLAASEVPTSNRGMKLNEAKKLKREQLAKLAAEEAEESARKMQQAAKLFLGGSSTSSMTPETAKSPGSQPKQRNNSRSKRKRDAEGEANGDTAAAGTPAAPSVVIEGGEAPSSSRPPAKRTKTETPVPPPLPGMIPQSSSASSDNSAPPAAATSGVVGVVPQSETPVPIPIPRQSSATTRSATSPAPGPNLANGTGTVAVTTPAPVKAPFETPVPLPKTEQRVSTTPIPPPTIRELPGREASKRETRGEAAKRSQQLSASTSPQQPQDQSAAPEISTKQSSSRGGTPRSTPAPESLPRRPGSRGKAASQEPQPSLAVDRSRRASTARNTPVPELKQPGKRTKRPAPGVVSTTSSGGNSAVGKRKAAPKKKARATKKDKGQVTEEMEDVDDEGNPIDPNEPRYCLCNRVSFGTMIQCDNVDNCKQEWFHLECVGLSEIPARTTKWYCPDCRKLLNIGEKGEINARGVKK